VDDFLSIFLSFYAEAHEIGPNSKPARRGRVSARTWRVLQCVAMCGVVVRCGVLHHCVNSVLQCQEMDRVKATLFFLSCCYLFFVCLLVCLRVEV